MANTIVSTSNADWVLAKKTKGLRALPMRTVFSAEVADKILLDTLEGPQRGDLNNMYCIGIEGDVWQQTPAKLESKYFFAGVDGAGWLCYEPRPDNEVECFELTADMVAVGDVPYIEGHWGTEIEGLGARLQRAEVGDFICRNTIFTTDQWVVRRRIFNNTYETIGAN